MHIHMWLRSEILLLFSGQRELYWKSYMWIKNSITKHRCVPKSLSLHIVQLIYVFPGLAQSNIVYTIQNMKEYSTLKSNFMNIKNRQHQDHSWQNLGQAFAFPLVSSSRQDVFKNRAVGRRFCCWDLSETWCVSGVCSHTLLLWLCWEISTTD